MNSTYKYRELFLKAQELLAKIEDAMEIHAIGQDENRACMSFVEAMEDACEGLDDVLSVLV
jgi:hypothetical protein